MKYCAVLLSLATHPLFVNGFGIVDFLSHHHQQHTAAAVAIHHGTAGVPHVASAISSVAKQGLPHPKNLLDMYTTTLKEHPLTTKMITGGTLATCGDAIAQTQAKNEKDKFEYDVKRASSFALFDMAYRALQHVSFPVIVEHCHGQYAMALFGTIPGLAHYFADKTDYLAAMEETLASQLGIVPFLYYPVFYVLTGLIQGLTFDEGLQRAQETFIPLMKRNLLFWIPVQFVQFEFIPTDLQIPFLSICGLCWTFILSVAAGSAKSYSSQDEEVGEVGKIMAIDSEQEEQLAKVVAAMVTSEDEDAVDDVVVKKTKPAAEPVLR